MNQSQPVASSTARFEKAPLVSLADEVVQVRLVGMEPGAQVTLRATMRDDLDHAWGSVSSFTADAAGTIDLSTQAPENGSYEGVEPMGFLWSMRPVDGVLGLSKTTALPTIIELTAEASGQPVAQTQIVRLVAGPGVTRTAVRDDGLYAAFFTPAGDGPHPTIMLLSGSGGGLSEPQAALYASHGYCALALAYFRAGQLPTDLSGIPLEYFERAIAWLEARPEVDAERLAVGGTSRGGELSLLLGSRYPQFKAVVASVPSAVVYGSVGGGEDGHTKPAWTYHGEAIPFLHSRPSHSPEYERPDGKGFALTPIYLRSLEQPELVRQATIPVEQINGPVLAISGKEDAMWPSSVYSDMVMERLAEHLHPYPDQHLAYAGTGHGVGQPWWPTTITETIHPVTKNLFALGGDPRQSAHARADAWSKILVFLDANLRADREGERV
jgi:dienelactone hydrolase